METKTNPNQSPFVKPTLQQTVSPAAKPASSNQQVMQSFTPPKKGVSSIKSLVILIIMVFFGVGAGYAASLFAPQTGASIIPSALNPNAPVQGKIYGNGDTAVFKDTAEGVLQNGGIDGEGQYHLVRPGGDSQNVYLTSSSVDLSQFIGRKIKVWGETQAAQHAGWLMDVGRVQVE
jgi:hypothetical protein